MMLATAALLLVAQTPPGNVVHVSQMRAQFGVSMIILPHGANAPTTAQKRATPRSIATPRRSYTGPSTIVFSYE